MGVKPECFLIVSLSWSLAAFPMLVWSPVLSDAGGRLPWNKEWEVLVFPLPLFLLAPVGWHEHCGSSWWLVHLKGLFVRSWRCFLGQELRITAVSTNSTNLLGALCAQA